MTTSFIPVPLADIHESKTNPRKTFEKGALAELTDSVRQFGVLQPVLLRQNAQGYELIAGARRLRAAKAAGLAEIPAVVRELDDKQVLEVQVIENLQREDLSPIEEARGYQLLHREHGYDVETLAAKVGKSKAYVYGRMKLCELPKKVLKLLEEDKLTVAQAQLVARIPHPDVAAKAAEEISGNRWDGPRSLEESRRIVHREFFLQLDKAPFDTGAVMLIDGVGSCGSCPKRTGNQKGLFDDVAGPDLCTDSKCFAAKKEAAWQNKKADAIAAGQKVLEGKAAEKARSYGSSFVKLDECCYDDPKGRTYRKLLGQAAKDLPTVLVQDQSGGGQVRVERAVLARALKTAGHDFAAKRKPSQQSSQEKAHKRRMAAVQLAGEALATGASKLDERAALLLWFRHGTIHHAAGKAVGDFVGGKGREAWLAAATVEQLRAVMVQVVAWSGGSPSYSYGRGYSTQWLAACKAVGITMAPFEKQVDAAKKAKPKKTKAPAKKASSKKARR